MHACGHRRRVDYVLSYQKNQPIAVIEAKDNTHAASDGIRQALINLNSERVRGNRKYVMRITSDELEGKVELDNFINPEESYPVIATTSKLMTTGVDAQTCKRIVLDQHIQSMTEFKQIKGTLVHDSRLQESHRTGRRSRLRRRPGAGLRTRR